MAWKEIKSGVYENSMPLGLFALKIVVDFNQGFVQTNMHLLYDALSKPYMILDVATLFTPEKGEDYFLDDAVDAALEQIRTKISEIIRTVNGVSDAAHAALYNSAIEAAANQHLAKYSSDEYRSLKAETVSFERRGTKDQLDYFYDFILDGTAGHTVYTNVNGEDVPLIDIIKVAEEDYDNTDMGRDIHTVGIYYPSDYDKVLYLYTENFDTIVDEWESVAGNDYE